MRAKYFLTGHLYFFLILAACIGLTSCNSDDEDEIVQQTWLEKYDGTKWVDEDDFLYIRIVNNTNIIFESWVNEVECYIHNVSDGNVNFNIIENSNNQLVFEVNEGDDMEKFTMKISGDTLTILLEYRDESDTLTFQKTNADVDNFPLCDL